MDAANRYGAEGTSFAAPRLSALAGLYLFHDGPVVCDGSVPPLGYAAAPDVLRWDNLFLGAVVGPGDPALRYCREFAARVTG